MVRVLGSVLVLSLVVGVANADTLFSQPMDELIAPDRGIVSEAVSGGFYDERAADNFVLAGDSSIEGLTFTASEEGFFTSPDWPGNLASFSIEIFADDAGLPGASLYSDTVSAAAVTAVDTGLDQFNGSDIYEVSYDLTSALNVVAGTYWLSVAANPVTDFNNDDSFFLAPGIEQVVGNAMSSPVGSPWALNPDATAEFAFSIVGIPEPSTILLLGLAAFAIRRR